MSVQTFAFSAEAEEEGGFEGYHRLYSIGADVERTPAPFHAHIRVRRFQRMILFERELGGLHHSRDGTRVRRDGFDHITLHLLQAGSLLGGPPGIEHRLRPGEIMLVDTSRPHWTRTDRARILTVQLARDVAEAAAGDLDGMHGAVLPEVAAGLLADFIDSLVRRADALPVAAVERAAATVAELLGVALNVAAAAPLARLLSNDAAQPVRRVRAEAYIDAHLGDAELDAEAIANGIGSSRSSLYRAFADDGGLMRHIQQRRLERLRAALRRPGDERSVAALAFACGFTDEKHSNRAFRAAFGMPPGRYRAAIREIRQDRSTGGLAEDVFGRWTHELY
jgi:AraC-like DNA-binding protein